MDFARKTIETFRDRYRLEMQIISAYEGHQINRLINKAVFASAIHSYGYVSITSGPRLDRWYVDRPGWSLRRNAGLDFPSFADGLRGLYEWLQFRGRKNTYYFDGEPTYEGSVTRHRVYPLRTIDAKGEPTVRLAWVPWYLGKAARRIERSVALRNEHLPMAELFLKQELPGYALRDFLIEEGYFTKS